VRVHSEALLRRAILRVAVNKTRGELDAAKNSLNPDPVRKMLGKPTISGLTKTLEKLKAETEDLKDRWLRLKEHREVLPNQVGVTNLERRQRFPTISTLPIELPAQGLAPSLERN
jgi:hypothetical protein